MILSPSPENIALAAKELLNGNVIGIPTETVYGLAGNVFDSNALEKIFLVKQRPTFDPLIVHVSSKLKDSPNLLEALANQNLIDLNRLSSELRMKLETLLRAFWPGPLTVIFPKHRQVPDLATSGLDTVAIRMPAHPVTQSLLQKLELPLAAPSANQFGHISPTEAKHVEQELGSKIPFVLDGGKSEFGVESTIILLTDKLVVLRPGGITLSQLQTLLPTTPCVLNRTDSHLDQVEKNQRETKSQISPGMLASHYAPRKTMFRLPQTISNLTDEQARALLTSVASNINTIGFLISKGHKRAVKAALEDLTNLPIVVQILSESGNLSESAQNLFSHMRKLDESKAEIIICEPFHDDQGLGAAISDRLNRASTCMLLK